MKVGELLERFRIKCYETKITSWVKDPRKGSPYGGKIVYTPTRKFRVSDAMAGDGDMLANNLKKELLFAYSSGPIALFSFRGKGKLMFFKINGIQVNAYSYRKIERMHSATNFMDLIEKIKEFSVDPINFSSPEFDVQVLSEVLK